MHTSYPYNARSTINACLVLLQDFRQLPHPSRETVLSQVLLVVKGSIETKQRGSANESSADVC